MTVAANGALINNGNTEASSAGLRLVTGGSTGPVPLPAGGTLRHDATGRYVAVGAPLTDPWLRTVTGAGTPWNFVKLTVSNGVQIFGIQEQVRDYTFKSAIAILILYKGQ